MNVPKKRSREKGDVSNTEKMGNLQKGSLPLELCRFSSRLHGAGAVAR